MRETDFSSQGGTPKSYSVEHSEAGDSQDEAPQPAPPQPIPVPQTPRILIQDRTPPDDAFPDSLGSPLTPPKRSSPPKSTKSEFKTPSPPKTLPDLPTPSSSDESDRNSPVKMPKTPRLGAQHSSRWLQTPKPPGGWLATPKPPTNAVESDSAVEERPNLNADDDRGEYPITPSRPPTDNTSLPAKTPKPPGGWLSTPAPAPRFHDESNSELEPVQPNPGLLTPVASLSKGSALDPKTPAAPGGWINTPVPRRSVLKVRFDSESPMVKEDSSAYGQADRSSSEVTETESRRDQSRSERSSPPRSPRKPKSTHIRVLDAFGREEEVTEPASAPSKSRDTSGSRSGLRVLDAMGREMRDEEVATVDESKFLMDEVAPTRAELVSRIRQGLDNLVSEFGDTDGYVQFECVFLQATDELCL